MSSKKSSIGGLLGDYTVWLDSLGSEISLAADGNLNGVIDQGDYDFWKANFGEILPGASISTAVPEPTALVMFLVAWFTGMLPRSGTLRAVGVSRR